MKLEQKKMIYIINAAQFVPLWANIKWAKSQSAVHWYDNEPWTILLKHT